MTETTTTINLGDVVGTTNVLPPIKGKTEVLAPIGGGFGTTAITTHEENTVLRDTAGLGDSTGTNNIFGATTNTNDIFGDTLKSTAESSAFTGATQAFGGTTLESNTYFGDTQTLGTTTTTTTTETKHFVTGDTSAIPLGTTDTNAFFTGATTTLPATTFQLQQQIQIHFMEKLKFNQQQLLILILM